ncbi:MAG: hypothetical protein A3C27_02535 [Candidatus Levybacteria bacterium RIFCSPHIGHO2_02_FULL_39_36]|nr:MAG: hypothetical protein A2689_02270 [Candidatus Levybacteria bacterium RIFCSPHIGHO2_01_FULL_38_96]OGH25364.1 MAG: hypothetical protein A3E68_02085 [Candidatus Levybacteria bacterium RIFCSPHIGHO2_12_FULL_39_39]OGH28769.1 MAG: hypothetical protein A3C27_02535 [Candidatus Levybacteria bacterium RIFCSPHIGHO2_02_FULL_39_36]OGH35949.1 MAG: hypothetical protein A3B43_02810 [Candidatus Levybacteria bacterium RIFCSPLOWO2_01_FULL_38_120]OGH45154.1 MAG: hypothetical protein A3H82_00720 [Candidatus Le
MSALLHDISDWKFNSNDKNCSKNAREILSQLKVTKDMMNTKSAKKIAEDKHKFLEGFLDRFLKEWSD